MLLKSKASQKLHLRLSGCYIGQLNWTLFSGKQLIIYCHIIQKIKSSQCPLCLWQFIHTIITVQLCNYFCYAALQPHILSNFLKMGPNVTLEYDSGFALPWNQQGGDHTCHCFPDWLGMYVAGRLRRLFFMAEPTIVPPVSLEEGSLATAIWYWE